MNLSVNACKPSFGMVLKDAVELAKIANTPNLDKLIDSQKDNLRYNISTTSDFEMRPCFAVSNIYCSVPLERFKSLASACAYADAVQKAAENLCVR